MTLIGFVFVLAIAGFFAFLIMRLFPVYSEYYSVVTDMNGVANEPGIANMPPDKVRELLMRRFYISYVETVKLQHIKVSRNNGYNLNVKYEVRRPLVYNLDYVAMFDKTVELSNNGVD